MLSFDSSLTDALNTHSTEAFFTLKLYYNDDTVSTNVIHISDQDRTDGSDDYFGLVSSWGSYNQSLDFFNFTTSTGNMSVKLINTPDTISGGRFSDLFSSKNFANRKWELFLNTSQAGTYDTSARMIGTGIISGDISYDTKTVSLTLLDFSSKYHKQLPTNVVDSATYTNAPEKNINKPIPMAYGDFHDKTGIGTIPTSPKFDYFFTKAKFPAIITNSFNESDGYVYANGDTETLHTVDNENIYIYNDGHFTACDTANTAVSNPQLKYKGTSWFLYIPLNCAQANIVNGNFNSSYTISVAPTGSATVNLSIPEVSNLGVVSSVDIIADYGTVDFSTVLTYEVLGKNGLSGGSPLTTINIQSGDGWDFAQNGTINVVDDSGGGGVTLEIEEMGLMVTFAPSKTFTKTFTEQYEVAMTAGIEVSHDEAGDTFQESNIRTRTKTINTPSVTDYIYYSGKGRKYDSSIVSRNSYTTSDFYENPVFIIEDCLRNELGLNTEIDTATFDASGNYDSGTPANDGFLKDIYGEDKISDIKFAFSQYKFIDSKDLITRLCRQILSWVFTGGDGKFKIKTLRRTGDYSGSDKTIDFNDISLKSISRTSLGAVRNDITINYNHDYGQNQFISSQNTTDATSQGTTVNGVSQALKLELDADTLDSTTATQLADAYMTIFKDRKVILDFTCNRPTYNDLEIGDIVEFSNWDSNIKIYGSAMGTDYYLISSISKKPNGCSVKAIKVS